MNTVPKQRLLNLELDNITMTECLQSVTGGTIYTPNIDHFVLLQKDKEFYQAYKSANYVVLDSQVIYLLGKIFRRPFKEKISGSDLFPRFCEYHKSDPAISIFVLGGMDTVAETVKNSVNERSGRELIVGACSPSKDFEKDSTKNDDVVRQIKQSGANVLAVGLGTPKQELWIYRHKHKLPEIQLFMGVGATFDFMTGNQRRAPHWMQAAGLEWFYRLLRDPRRFVRRYLVTDMQFFYYFTLDLFRAYSDPFVES
jgi:exopolysaccharide biosynthesis WecB/TagA/CpsF family protein